MCSVSRGATEETCDKVLVKPFVNRFNGPLSRTFKTLCKIHVDVGRVLALSNTQDKTTYPCLRRMRTHIFIGQSVFG